MMNNMTRNDLPYAPPVNGRWYKIFLETDNNGKAKITSSDIEVILDQNNESVTLAFDRKFRVIDYIMDPFLTPQTSTVCEIKLGYSTGTFLIDITNIYAIDNFNLYVYCVRL